MCFRNIPNVAIVMLPDVLVKIHKMREGGGEGGGGGGGGGKYDFYLSMTLRLRRR